MEWKGGSDSIIPTAFDLHWYTVHLTKNLHKDTETWTVNGKYLGYYEPVTLSALRVLAMTSAN